MKPARPSVYEKRLEAILDKYRDKEPRAGAEREHLLRLWREFVYPMRWRLLLALCCALLTNLQPYVWPYMSKIVVDSILCVQHPEQVMANLAQHEQWIIILFVVNCSIHITVVLASWQYNYNITLVGQRVVFELRKALHNKLTALPLSFFDRTQTGRLLSVVLDDVSTIQASVGGVAVNFCNNVILMLIGTVLLCRMNWHLALLVFAAIPFYVINFRYYRPRIRDGNIAARRANTALYNTVEERVTAVRTLKVFGRERAEVRSFTESANNLARLTVHILRLTSYQSLIAGAVSVAATGAILYLSAQDVLHGTMTLGTMMMFYAYSAFIFNPAVAISDQLGMEMPRISVVLRRIFDLLEADPEPIDPPDALAITDAQGEIALEDVTFTYPGDEAPTLHNVTVRIPAGKQVAVMGPSGAGKSTLLYLLMRFYDPEQGVVRLDGHDLREIQLRKLRDRITLVMQEPVIFSGTVAENIRYGRLDAGDDEVRRAARDADLHEFIMSLPDSYETVVGERGMSLSGGQRQRLALAASLLSRPSVLLLDDTTSALDAATEARVRATLNRLMQGRTCFVVTHRISTAMASDLVIVLEGGRLTQFGQPGELLAQDGLFRRVYEQQNRESADMAGSADVSSARA